MDKNLTKTRVWLKEELAKEIISGAYSFNQAFPGIQQVAEKYQVSYLTASRAMKMLQREGYLRCENGVGHFVNYIAENTPVSQKKVNIITNRDFYKLRKQYFSDAIELFRSNGWNVKMVLCQDSDISSVAPEINSPESYSVICGLNVSWKRFQASFGSVAKRVLILGILSGNQDITSIISNEYETIRRAMEHFAKKGRQNVAILSMSQKQELEALRIAAWRSMVLESGRSYEWAVKHCFSFPEEAGSRRCAEKLATWIKSIAEDTDGLIVPVCHAQAIRACMKLGVKIPDEMSVLLIALSAPELSDIKKCLPKENFPQIEVFDHNYAGHFQCAFEILEERFRSGQNAEGCWYFCPPGKIQKLGNMTE